MNTSLTVAVVALKHNQVIIAREIHFQESPEETQKSATELFSGMAEADIESFTVICGDGAHLRTRPEARYVQEYVQWLMRELNLEYNHGE